jgi:hypothetical protein
MTEQAAEDLPLVEDDQATAEITETQDQAQAESATAEDTKSGEYVETDSEAVQARINKLTAEKFAEKRRAEELEQRLKQLESAKSPEAKPTLEQFDYDDAAYQEALINWTVTQRVSEQQKAQAEQEVISQRNVEQEQRQAMFNQRMEAYRVKAPDYEQVVSQVPDLPQDTLNAILEHEKGPQLAYHLGKHLDIADQITRMNPATAAMKLGELAAKLSAPVTETSKAPEPIETVSSGGSMSKNLEDMSMDEIMNL